MRESESAPASARNSSVAECLARAALPRLEALLLLEAATGLTRVALLTHPERPLSVAQETKFLDWCARRRLGEPLAYLIGRREFYGLDFAVNQDVLIPRPETELLVEWALARIAGGARRVLDLGTGSGAVAIAIAKHAPAAEVWATDVSAKALAVAAANAACHGAAIRCIESHWFDALREERFDVIVANPPYVAFGDPHLMEGDLRFEPIGALVGGHDGLDAIRAIAGGASAMLVDGGWMAMEHGYNQGESVAALFAALGYRDVTRHADLAGIWRVTSCRSVRSGTTPAT